jgi:hypothetical protein
MPEYQDRARNRFVLWFFAAGTLVPVILIVLGLILGSRTDGRGAGRHSETALWVLTWIVWPTWILMLDAEHTSTVVFMVLLAAPLNGLWFGTFALLVWYLRQGLRRMRKL